MLTLAAQEVGSVAASAASILQLGVLVLAAKIGGRLVNRWRLPRVVGELLAGVAVGPCLLGGVALPFMPQGLMGGTCDLFAGEGPLAGVLTLTLVVFFFLLGLDTDVRQMRRAPTGSVLAGAAGFTGGFAAVLAALYWGAGWGWCEPRTLLVATVASVASVGMLARMLPEREQLEGPSGRVALGAALVDNALGVFLFTVFAAVSAQVGPEGKATPALFAALAARTVLGLGVVVACGFLCARFANALALRERNYTSAFTVSAASLLIAGGVSGATGLPVVAGAFAMGVAFSTTDLRHEIRERLDFVSLALVPACFAAVGLRVCALGQEAGASAGWVALLVAGGVLAKLAGGVCASAAAGLNGRGCLRAGLALLPRGEITLALLAAALGAAALPSVAVAVVVALVVLTCLCGPALTGRAFARGGAETRAGVPAPAPVTVTFRFSTRQAAMLMIGRAVEVFEDDGFYAHRLNRHQVLYRISREAQVIHLRESGGTVTFECAASDRPLVSAVMLELASGVEKSLRELQKPLDDVVLRRTMQGEGAEASPAGAGVLRNRFSAGTLRPRLFAATKQGAIAELVGVLAENGLVADRERALQAVLDRELGLSSGLEHGVAIPHARTDAVTRLVCAVGLKREGIAFDSMDGKPARIVALVLAPEAAATPQLQLIAQLCRLLDERGRAALLACETAEDMFDVLAVAAPPAAGGPRAPATLASCLGWQSVALELDAAEQAAAVHRLLALCVRSGGLEANEDVRRQVRELEAGCARRVIGGQVAVFAAEVPEAKRLVAALGVSRGGVRLAAEGGLCPVCVMLLYPAGQAEEAARLLEGLDAVFAPGRVASLLAARTSAEALAVVSGAVS